MADAQISSPAVAAGASTYEVKRTVEFTLKTVNALFTDNGAAGDWLPAVVIRSDAGLVIARAADQNVKVTGGDDAEVSWFPGVKNSGPGFTGLPWARGFGYFVGLVPSGVVTELGFSATAGVGTEINGVVPFDRETDASGVHLLLTATGNYLFRVNVVWPAFAGDRYIEVTSSGQAASDPPQLLRGDATPTDDVQVLTGIVQHFGPGPDRLSVNAFQASGVGQAIDGNQGSLLVVYVPLSS